MIHIQDSLGAIPAGMRWCPHCNGYSSSLKESGGRCSRCAGTGLVVDDVRAITEDESAESLRRPEPSGSQAGPGAP